MVTNVAWMNRTCYSGHPQVKDNLNDLEVATDGNPQAFCNPTVSTGSASVYFRRLEDSLIRHLAQADIVLGCVAWLTSGRILDVLATRKGIGLVVQKEDFLRPDTGFEIGENWRKWLRQKYAALPSDLSRWNVGLGYLSSLGDPTFAPVRCVGNHNREGAPAFPRMHHKFVLFCRGVPSDFGDESACKPYAVWTGSFNFTANAGNSLENALYITDQAIIKAYYEEWQQIEAVSEPLNWESDWVEPEWRIGT